MESSTDTAAKLLAVDFHRINSFLQVEITALQSEKDTDFQSICFLQISNAMYFDGEGVLLFIYFSLFNIFTPCGFSDNS